jgi:hypothetical protein
MKRSLAVCFLVVFGSTALVAQAPTPNSSADPRLGTWKLSLQKSTFSPGPAPQSQLRRYEARQDGFFVLTISSVGAEGNPTFTHSVYKLDGKDYAQYTQATLSNLLATGVKSPGTFSFRVVDAKTVILTGKTDGVAGLPNTFTISGDGKTMTSTTRGTNAQGQQINNVLVFERVQ